MAEMHWLHFSRNDVHKSFWYLDLYGQGLWCSHLRLHVSACGKSYGSKLEPGPFAFDFNVKTQNMFDESESESAISSLVYVHTDTEESGEIDFLAFITYKIKYPY